MKELLFRIQQYVAITEVEAKAFSIVLLLLLLGLGVQYAQAHWMIPDLEVPPLPEPVEESSSLAAFPDTAVVSDTARVDSTGTTKSGPATGQSGCGDIDLNSATALQLQSLPGIGPKLADRIISHRNQQGPFRRSSDLMKVKGIGAKTFARLEPLICVDTQQD